MNVSEMRTQIGSAYPGTKWAARVKGMSDNQVIATYMRLKGAGKL